MPYVFSKHPAKAGTGPVSCIRIQPLKPKNHEQKEFPPAHTPNDTASFSLVQPQNRKPIARLGEGRRSNPYREPGLRAPRPRRRALRLVEVIHFEDTETGFLPSRIYAQFKRDGKVCFEADLDESGEQRICSVHVFDPTITYKGLGAGTPISEILKTEAQLYLTGNYSSCFFDAYFQLDNICFAFDFFNGKSFSRTGKARIINREFSEPTLFPLSAPDFQHDAVISKICIYPL